MRLPAWIELLRPTQWLKNLIVFFPPFLSGSLFHSGFFWATFLPFVAFCGASSAGYILNDLFDCRQDANHPVKKNRPLPSGAISRSSAIFLACVLCIFTIALSLSISEFFLWYVFGYLAITFSYSLFLKNIIILDIFCISLGFVLRLYGGGEAFGVVISDWLFLSVFLLSMFLSVGKRYSERKLLGADGRPYRRMLEGYPAGFLEGAMYLSGAVLLMTYSMYTISKPGMVYSVPLCMYGLLQYLMRIKRGESGDPTESLLKDVPLLITGATWILFVGWSIYS